MTDSSNQHYELAIGLAKEALKALLILNGGAATALIALTDRSADSADYSTAILSFGLGAFFATLAMTVAYLSQLNYANHLFDDGMGADSYKRHGFFQYTAIITVLASLLSAGAGLGLAFAAT